MCAYVFNLFPHTWKKVVYEWFNCYNCFGVTTEQTVGEVKAPSSSNNNNKEKKDYKNQDTIIQIKPKSENDQTCLSTNITQTTRSDEISQDTRRRHVSQFARDNSPLPVSEADSFVLLSDEEEGETVPVDIIEMP